MQTYSHLLLTAVLQKATRIDNPDAVSGLLAGSAAPDVPLALLSVGYVVDRRYVRPHLPDKTRCSPTYNELYFNNSWWIAAHNSLHAPLPLFALALLGLLLRRRWLLWFALGCGLHTAVDIFSHADDGPVLLFPLDWHKRFLSPISYWDPQHGGRTFRLIEHLLDLLLIGYLILQRVSDKREPIDV
jgi:hypothetical protein